MSFENVKRYLLVFSIVVAYSSSLITAGSRSDAKYCEGGLSEKETYTAFSRWSSSELYNWLGGVDDDDKFTILNTSDASMHVTILFYQTDSSCPHNFMLESEVERQYPWYLRMGDWVFPGWEGVAIILNPYDTLEVERQIREI